VLKSKILSQLPKIFVLLLIFALAQVICIGGIWYIKDLNARKEISTRLEIEPSWKSLEKYIETHFEVGMSRNEVLKQADEVGFVNINYFFIGEMYCEVFSFSVGPFNSDRGGRWSLCYDQNDTVIKIERKLIQ
jgi:hypothetical protein